MNEKNSTPNIGTKESTNPLTEQLFLPYKSCNLGSTNLGYFVKDYDVDWKRFEKTVRMAVLFWITLLI
jgi:ribonucleoside-diphosphate reductase alpha chain